MKYIAVSVLLIGSIIFPVMPVEGQTQQVIGGPSLSGSIQDNRIEPSAQENIAVTISNSGYVIQSGPSQFVQRVNTARNVQATIKESQINAPISVDTGTVTLGALQSGSIQQATFSLETGGNLEPGTYEIPIEIDYSYTNIANYEVSQSGYSNIEYVDRSGSKTIDIEVVVEERPRFTLDTPENNQLSVGDSDRFNFSVSNTGNERAQDISIQLSSQSPTIQFGEKSGSQSNDVTGQTDRGSQTSAFIPSLSPGEVYNASVKVSSTTSSTSGQYPIQATVNYERPNGISGSSDPITIGGSIQREQQFALSDASSNLRVGEEGTLTATLTNQGPNTAQDVVISLQEPATGIEPDRSEFALGTLQPGASETIRFPITVADTADTGPYQFTHRVQYQNNDGTEQTSDPLNARIEVAEQRDTFAVAGVNTSLQVGSTGLVEVELTNNDESTLRNINAKAFVDDPLSASSDEAYIASLEPGETATISFDMSVTGDVPTRTHPLELDFQYQQPDGDTVLSNTYQVPITLTPAPEGGLPVFLIFGGLVVVSCIVGGVIYLRR